MPIPARTEAADYYFPYIDRIGEGDICQILDTQLPDTIACLRAVSEDRSLHRYAPGKWSMRQLVSHMNDNERAFVFRALWIARGFDSPLPGFDHEIAAAGADADARSWASHVDEFQAVRSATVAFFRHLPADAWDRRGVAGGNPFTVRALAFIAAGHVAHHVQVLQERY